VIVSAIDLVAFIAIAVTLKDSLGHVAVSMAVAGSSFVQMALLLYFVARKLPQAHGKEIAVSCARTLGASLLAVLLAYALARYLASAGIARALPGIIAFAVFSAIFAIAAHLMRSPELQAMTHAIRRRLGRA